MLGHGTVSIHAENIMPVIKQWLYSDKDIFMREVVSNACDAISKHRRLVASGEAEKDENPYRIDVVVDKAAGTLTFTDNGIGMTADEVEKYIAQVAFSGASDFIQKYAKDGENEDTKIIGHFGLGFYSVFMVSKKVVIDTKSYTGAPAVRWTSEDGMSYDMEESDRTERGTSITLTINDADSDFLNVWTVRATLDKHCAFMPVPIYLSEIPEPAREGEEAPEKKEPEQVNDPNPLWMRKPTDCTDEDYKAFYHKVFHDYEDPLFWIHLNAEYPFNLKGILYFPRIKNELSASEGMVKLYNNQVFVADNIKEVIPEFLLLLKGVIDCPDLPLNVSRSFLQNDGYVRKMSAYITRKVADRLLSEFNNNREEYQRYWDDIHPFVKYGFMRDDKFYDRAKKALLFKTTSGAYLTLEEYRNRNADGEECTVYYTSDEKRQAQMIKLYTDQGRDVVILNTLIDTNFISFLEYAEHEQKITFRRVDAATDSLTEEGETSEDDRAKLEARFRAAMNDSELTVSLKPFKSDDMIAMITVDEQNRRLTEMSARWGGRDMNLPEKRTLALNSKHPLIHWIENAPDGEETNAVCAQVADLAEMARQPLVAERMVEFLKRSNALLTKLIEK
ncbi:MAG: molecular chaperone HtpG [Candidatus Faecivicinus sp.]|nr:molecular chaperone HtpG [Candidatus Faecivicinus sp.]